MKGYAHVAESFLPDDTEEGSLQSGAGGFLMGTASGFGASVTYAISPGTGLASLNGRSRLISYAQWRGGKETQADGYVQLFDQFRVTGQIDPNAPNGTVTFRWAGKLLPNHAFESEYAAANGGAIPLTASVTMDMTVFWLNDNGAVVGSVHASDIQRSTALVTDFQVAEKIYIPITESARAFRVAVTIGGVGLRGGGFDLSGQGQTPQVAAAIGGEGGELAPAAAGGASRLPDSFLDIEVALPPGLAMTATDGHYMHQVIIPEPAGFALVPAAIMLTVWRRRR